ncbi:MAG TPA: enoyl-CoA hydratase/isomerase family protein [Burkholderiaceae bacterium]|mgnify:CR=1 FL=1|nr:enoyl-CoA hydratase/isomerase family protein [Burkholderiaceae bacterium]
MKLLRPSRDHARIVLDRAAHRNALGLDELRGIGRAADALAADPPRVVSIVAQGAAFGVGGDIAALGAALDRGGMEAWLREGLGAFHRGIAGLRALDAAIVVGVQGAAAGGTLGLVWVADHVIAGDDLLLDLAYARLGATPDGGTSWFAPRLAGRLRAFELLTLTPRLDAQSAVAYGLANRAVPAATLRDAVDDVVARWLAVPPESLRGIVRLLRDAPSRELAGHLDAELEAFVRAAARPEFAERVAAFLRGKRPAGDPQAGRDTSTRFRSGSRT